jgi:YrbI family 3-deoxy-D-manno-octulosonate 8-phosphate phosphatase
VSTAAVEDVSPQLLEKLRALRFVVFDFDGVFTDNMVYVFEDGREAVRCSRSDGMGLQKLASVGVGCSILSTEINPVVTARARKLKLECIQGCENKIAALTQLAQEKSLPFQEIAFVGNDINDACALEKVGVPIVVADAHPDVLPLGVYRTSALGGHGAVREVCDLIVRAKQDSARCNADSEHQSR